VTLIPRLIQPAVEKLFHHKMVVLYGAPGVGKTTLLRASSSRTRPTPSTWTATTPPRATR
jgi:replication-associated recombination protein RarA